MRIFFLLLALGILSSCVNNLEYTGLKINQDDVNLIVKHKYSKEQVAQLVGSPTFSSDLGGDTWYYVYSVTNKTAFFRPELVDEEVVAIKFDKNGKYLTLEQFDKEAIRKISAVDDTTPTLGTKTNPVQQILRNIQKYSVPNFSRKKPGGA